MTIFTSGGTNGYKLNFEKHTIPDGYNAYGIIHKKNSILEIVEKFHAIGWSVRKSSWTDYEIEGEWAKINVTTKGKPLINCAIDENYFDKFIKILISFQIHFSLKLYDEDGKLIKEIIYK